MSGYLRTFCGGDGYAFDAAHAHRSALEFDAVVVAGPEEGDWSVMDRAQAAECGFIDDPTAVEVVDHPGEMGPHYCPAGCAATGADDHEDYCEAFCRTHRCELDPDAGCGYCILDDAADEMGIGRRSRAHLWATGMVR